jgi:hypothetical protein
MKVSVRIGVVGAITVIAATFAGSALGALTPTFAVTGSRLGADQASGPTLSLATNAADDPVARLTIYVPPTYTLASPASPSSTIGNVTATALVADAGNASQTLKGSIVGTPPANTTAACDPGTHVATWSMNLTVPGVATALTVPMYVDQATAAETSYASYKVVVCLPPPDVPAGTAGRSPLGAKLISATFDLDNFTGGGNGENVWRTLWVPYAKGTGQPNAAGSVEAQSIVRVPTVVTLLARKAKGVVTLTGAVKETGNGIGGVAVTIGSGPRSTQLKKAKVVKTASNGTFTARVAAKKSAWYGATAQVPRRSLAPSFCKATFGVPCVAATVGASRVVGKAVKR